MNTDEPELELSFAGKMFGCGLVMCVWLVLGGWIVNAGAAGASSSGPNITPTGQTIFERREAFEDREREKKNAVGQMLLLLSWYACWPGALLLGLGLLFGGHNDFGENARNLSSSSSSGRIRISPEDEPTHPQEPIQLDGSENECQIVCRCGCEFFVQLFMADHECICPHCSQPQQIPGALIKGRQYQLS